MHFALSQISTPDLEAVSAKPGGGPGEKREDGHDEDIASGFGALLAGQIGDLTGAGAAIATPPGAAGGNNLPDVAEAESETGKALPQAVQITSNSNPFMQTPTAQSLAQPAGSGAALAAEAFRPDQLASGEEAIVRGGPASGSATGAGDSLSPASSSPASSPKASGTATSRPGAPVPSVSGAISGDSASRIDAAAGRIALSSDAAQIPAVDERATNGADSVGSTGSASTARPSTSLPITQPPSAPAQAVAAGQSAANRSTQSRRDFASHNLRFQSETAEPRAAVQADPQPSAPVATLKGRPAAISAMNQTPAAIAQIVSPLGEARKGADELRGKPKRVQRAAAPKPDPAPRADAAHRAVSATSDTLSPQPTPTPAPHSAPQLHISHSGNSGVDRPIADGLRADRIEGLIDNVLQQREGARHTRPAMVLNHAEFGLVNVRLEGPSDNLRAVLSNRDPGFISAVHSALEHRGIAASSDSAPNSSRGNEQGASGQAASQSGSGAQDSQARHHLSGQRDQYSQDGSARQSRANEPAHSEPRPRSSTIPRHGRDGALYA